ncbi:MAG: SDR family oxidoreductase [Phycisphaerales bacterium]
MEIKGKTALITGATGKLCRAIVLSLAEAGVNCICVYNKNKKMADALRAALDEKGVRSLFVQADISSQAGVDKVFAKLKKFDRPEILINGAAVFEKMPVSKINFDYVRKVFDINFSAAMIFIQKFVETALKKKESLKPIAKIINITDATIEKPPKGYSVYSATKAALAFATISLAKELGPDITVNAVAPGLVHWQKGATLELKNKILSHIPMKRAGLPEEIAHAVKFLLENDYITGRTISIDGGWTL